MPDAASEAPRTFRDGRYRVVRVLGEGAQATTFEAVDAMRGALVAVKCFRVRGAKSWKEVELAEREATVLAGISHPKLPRYVEHFEEGGELFLVTEKIEGESLAALRARGVGFSERDVVRFLHDTSDALDYLHGRAPPIVHRDIKPSNVIRRPDGTFALIDFGAVRDRMKPEGGSTVVGTFGYMAPEQFQGRAMPTSDVYAVAATALTLLTGREPEDLPHKGLAVDVPAALAGTRVRPALVRAIEAMLVPDPDNRAPAIAPLLASLDVPTSEPPPAERPHTRREERRERRAEHAERRAIRRYERQFQREGGMERHDAWGRARGPNAITGILFTALLFGLAIAEVAVWVALRMGVPLLLWILSPIFGEGMRRAAGRTSEAGKRAAAAIGRARRGLLHTEEPGVRVEVKEAPGGRVRVEEAGDGRAEEEAAATEEESGADKRMRRG